VRHRQERLDVVLNHTHGHAKLLIDLAIFSNISPTILGASPSVGSSKSSSFGFGISPRATASICCCPVDTLRANTLI
jgi:hypothetical protein